MILPDQLVKPQRAHVMIRPSGKSQGVDQPRRALRRDSDGVIGIPVGGERQLTVGAK